MATLTWRERDPPFACRISERFLIAAPTFVICLANGLVLPQASGYQPKTWLSESFVHCRWLEFSPQANHTERSLSNRLKIHKTGPRQRQELRVSTSGNSFSLTDKNAAFQTPAWSEPCLLPRNRQHPGVKSIKNWPQENCGILGKVQQGSRA